jgi:hypothetical protein
LGLGRDPDTRGVLPGGPHGGRGSLNFELKFCLDKGVKMASFCLGSRRARAELTVVVKRLKMKLFNDRFVFYWKSFFQTGFFNA